MTDIAKHIRIFEPTANDEFVTKRTTAIKGIENEYKKKKTANEKMIYADAVGKLLLDFTQDPQGISTTVATAIKKQSTSFVVEGSELEVVTCALLGFLQWIETSGNSEILGMGDTIALALWSCLSFQKSLDEEPKLEALRRELITASQNRIATASVAARSRSEIESVVATSAPDDGLLATFNNNLNTTYNKVINDLRSNAILDREEIECLWWVLSEWSSILDLPLQSLNSIQKAVVSGIELSALLRMVPSIAHRNLLTRYLDNNEMIDISEVLVRLGDRGDVIKNHLSKFTIISQAKLTFPLFSAILYGTEGLNGSDIKRPLTEWCFRALIEGSMINLNTIIDNAK